MDLMRKQILFNPFIAGFLVFIYIVGSTEADLYGNLKTIIRNLIGIFHAKT